MLKSPFCSANFKEEKGSGVTDISGTMFSRYNRVHYNSYNTAYVVVTVVTCMNAVGPLFFIV